LSGRSPNGWCRYGASNGGEAGLRQRLAWRGTGVRDGRTVTSRRQAQKIANEYEDVARRKRTARQVQRVIPDLWEEIAGESLPDCTVRDFAERWLRERETSKISFHSLRHTTTSLRKNAGVSLRKNADVSPAIAEEFVGHGPTSRPRP
jgi:integrase